jgi:hypothetical protein
MENRNFDAALGWIYLKEMIDFVRIYAKTDTERLKSIREKYLDEIHRIRQQ